jgi:ABC-type nickel/cobalt efflux system permease component RcnA
MLSSYGWAVRSREIQEINLNHISNVSVYLLFSVFAAVFINILVIASPSDSPTITISEKEIIAAMFIMSCVIGISFTVNPNWARRYQPWKKNREKKTNKEATRLFQGHHPDCHTFQNHRIQWKHKTWCAGCLGLLIGLCVSIMLMILYLILDVTQSKIISYLLFIIGLFILTFVYIEIVYSNRHPLLHVFSNSLLPLSFFIIIIAIIGLTGKLVYGFFTILLCFLWLDVRIQLSKWRHSLLCTYCTETCKIYDTII